MSDSNVRISVRNLVEFILKCGDIDNRSTSKNDADAMQAGSRMHRKIQNKKGPEYSAEVALKTVIDKGDFTISVEGRADGIIIEETSEGSSVTIDEIKGVYKDLAYLNEPIEVHKAQAMCYAYIYCKDNELENIGICLTYVNLDTEEIKYFRESCSYTFLRIWFDNLIDEYYKWARFQHEWFSERDMSVKPMQFPFEYRDGQRNLAASVYTAVRRKKRLFIQAPTGVGKTMSTLFPAVKSLGEGLTDKIFYLTAKTITRTVAKEAVSILSNNSLKLKTIILTAKDKACICEETECNPDSCPHAKGHYDRINEAVFDMLSNEDLFDRDIIESYAYKHRVCPFEMGLDASLWCDLIICDYNYVFDPKVYLKRFFSEGIKGEYLFLVDEAHNLVDRAREMFSAALYKEDFLELKRSIKYYSRKLEKHLEKCNKNLLELKRECEDYTLVDNIGSFVLSLMSLSAEIEKFLEETSELDKDIKQKLLDFYFSVRHFLNMYDRLDENYVVYTEHERDNRFKIKLLCVNTSKNLRECLDKGRSTVFFSATLLPIMYYKELLSGEPDDYAIYAKSPFEESNRLLLIGSDVSSKYTRRNYSEYKKMADYIVKTADSRKGNYMVFFPSYSYMQEVYECLCLESVNCICQRQGMNEEEREQFITEFCKEQPNGLVGLCVLGGIFSEGIDLKADRLIGALVIGTGLPQISNEKEILKSYYDEKGECGFDYAYRFPGMNKVLQAAGRVIRTSDDRGVILLLDSRFNSDDYKKLFPREWEKLFICNVNNVSLCLKDFWNENIQ